jgi:hypothetical protein
MFTEAFHVLSRDFLLRYQSVRCRLSHDTCDVVGVLYLRCRARGYRQGVHFRHRRHYLLATAARAVLPVEILVIIGGRAPYNSDGVIYHDRRGHRDSMVTCVKVASCFCDVAVRLGQLNCQ